MVESVCHKVERSSCKPAAPSCQSSCSSFVGNSCWAWIIAFIILWAFIALILYLAKPSMIMKIGEDGKPTIEIDNWKLFWISLVIAIIVALIIWALRSCCNGKW